MTSKLKIVLAVLFVAAVSVWVAKGCIRPHKPVPGYKKVTAAVVRQSAARSATVAPVPGDFRMAIILDDWGTNYGLVKQAVEIHRPLTLSILPHLKHSKKIAEEAHQNGLGVMLHLPMEPKIAREKMEPHTILTTTPDLEVVRTLEEALAGIPYAEGVNNHTGSKATCDRRVMRLVLSRLKERGLFFVDSFVTAETVGPEVAGALGVNFAKRDSFIDNVNTREAIRKQLREATRIALKKGEVVVIGHDRKVTLAAIKDEVPQIEKQGVRLVLVRELVKKAAP